MLDVSTIQPGNERKYNALDSSDLTHYGGRTFGVQRSSSRHLRHADRKTQRISGGIVPPSPFPTWARRPRSLRVLTPFALVVAAIVGPACHDATGPNSSLVPVPSFTIVSGN